MQSLLPEYMINESFVFAAVSSHQNQTGAAMRKIIMHVLGQNYFDQDLTVTKLPAKERDVIHELASECYLICVLF